VSVALRCVACDYAIPNEPHTTGVNQPDGGLSFTSYGHWPSSLFDPMDGSYLEVNVCDQCLLRAGSKGQVLLHLGASSPKPKKWKAE
jgi:hypothetical protein